MRRSVWFAIAALGAVTVATVIGVVAMSGGDQGPVESSIAMQPVEGLGDDFALGADVSSVLSLEESGVVFKDADGHPQDLFALLKRSGVTHVRVRVWNDPFDSQGRGYGGGNVGPDRATEIAKRATDAGLKVLVDFHYSDFWADPSKQQAPKAWKDMTAEEKATAAGQFTHDVLTQMKDAGVDVAMVQVGNETNNGVAGETSWPAMTAIFSAGSAAVREVFPDALVAVHFANPEQEGTYARYAQILDHFGVDYDVFASSYYPFWHGTTENLTAVLSDIATTYGKKVMVAETSWVRTLDDGDGSSNVISSADQATAYAISQQGQADAFRATVQAVHDVGNAGIGVFYWEPAWVPVGPPEDVAANAALWETYGSGWATSFAGEYDPADAGQYYGGSGWDNQALFGFDGTALDSLRIFQFVRTGATAPLAITTVDAPSLVVSQGDPVDLPATVTAHYNDGSTQDLAVSWDPVAADAVGVQSVTGTLDDGSTVTATVDVRVLNDIVNGGFEDDDLSMWTFDSDAETFAVVDNNVPAAIDERVLNFWSSGAYTFSVSQTVTGLEPGTYRVAVQVHGEDTGTKDAQIALTARGTEGDWSAPIQLNGWQAWYTAEIPDAVVGRDGTLTVAVEGSAGAGDWGFIDGFELVPADT